jgi:GT2 family glycosyltransferase
VDAIAASHGNGTQVIRLGGNAGFPAAVNAALAASSGDWILLVNDDATLEVEAVSELLAAGRTDSRIGSVAAQIRFADRPGTINSAGLGLDRLGVGFEAGLGSPADPPGPPRAVFGACGCVALYRRRMLEDVGGFDPRFFFGLEDLDVAWRARRHGWTAVYAPSAVAHHRDGASAAYRSPFKYHQTGRNRLLTLAKNADRQMLRRWPRMALHDLAYVAYVAATDRSLAPLRGRVAGLRHWREFRRDHRPDGVPIALARPGGLSATLRRRRVRSAQP